MTIKKAKFKKSFTLIEVLLATSIFVILVTLGMTAFSTVMNWKKRTNAENELQAASRHAMEVIAQAVEGADLSVLTADYYGFKITPPNELTFPSFIFKYDSTTKTLKKGDDLLIPSNISVDSLTFSGSYKNSTSLDQQPYVRVTMILKTKNPDPVENTYKTAAFQTAFRPQAFEAFTAVEVQSGLADGDNGATHTFAKNFTKPPKVMISRTMMNEDDDDTFVSASTISNFTFSSSTSNQEEYFVAVSGELPGLIETGPYNDLTYKGDFSQEPISFVMVNINNIGDKENMHYIIKKSDDTDLSRVFVGGQTLSPYTWFSFNPTIINWLKGQDIPIQAGNQPTKASSNFGCEKCEVEVTGAGGRPTGVTYTGYKCAFRETDLSSSYPNAKVGLGGFTEAPKAVILSAASNNSALDYTSTGTGDNGVYKSMNTPGIPSVTKENFIYTNKGGDIVDTKTCTQSIFYDRYYTGSQMNYIINNYSINYLAIGQDFSIKWRFK